MKTATKTWMSLALAAFGVVAAVAAPIRLKSGEIDPAAGTPRMTTKAAASLYAADAGVRVYLVQCETAITPEWRSAVEQAGGKILGYVPDNAYLVAADSATAANLVSSVKYAYFGEYRAAHKISESLSGMLTKAKSLKLASADESVKTSVYAGEFILSVFPFAKAADVAEKVSALDGCVVVEADGDVVKARLSETAVPTVLSWAEIEWLEPYVPEKSLNNVAAESPRMNVKTVWPGGDSGLGLTGAGQVVAVCDTGLDTGDAATLHEDVRGRVTRTYCYGRSGDWSDPDGHGTHVAGSVLGNGEKSGGAFKGMAYEASLIFQSSLNSRGGLTLPSDYKMIFQAAYNDEGSKKGARIHSNSWGSGSQDNPGNLGVYNSGSRGIDQFLFEHPDMLIFFAAGNEGIDSDGNGVIDSDSLCNQATAKNCMSVGACENNRTTGGYSTYTWGQGWPSDYPANPVYGDKISGGAGLAAFSSRGPCDDGRIKPDIVAPGTDVVSLHSSLGDWGWRKYNNYYEYMGGTSMATPLTAGAAVLVRQWLVEKRHISNPDGATVKAVMLAGAKSLTPGQYGTGSTREIPSSYPNNVEGWGQVNLGNSLANDKGVSVFDAKVIGHGETQEYNVSVGSAGSPLSIVMVYMDAPASLSASAQLVNDLDLTVVTPSGATLYPNSRTSADRVNNVEGVRIAAATKGVYTIRVKAYSITSPMSATLTGGKADATRYSVAVSGASPSAGLELAECRLSNKSAASDTGTDVTTFNKGEDVYVYARVHNPGGEAHSGGFAVKHALVSGAVSKGSLDKPYEVTVAAGGDYDISAYVWSALQNLSAGSYTYKMTLSAAGMDPVVREIPFTVVTPVSPLASVVVIGASTVGGGTKSTYTCRATLEDGTVVTATPVWTIDSGNAYASIDQNGQLQTYSTAVPRSVVIRASCTYNGVTRSGTKTVAINPVLSLPAALDCEDCTLTSGGDVEWFGQRLVTHDGIDAAQSGAVSHNQTSYFETTVTGPCSVSFWYRTSTELYFDELVVSADGIVWFKASGESDWMQHSFALGAGGHVLRFAYVKDVNRSVGEDAVYLDGLAFTTDAVPVSLTITGNGTMSAGSAQQLGCTARMSDGTDRDIGSAAVWSIASGSAYASISSAGLLTANASTVDHSVVVRAEYTVAGVTRWTTRTIVITGVVPVPTAPVITRAGEGTYDAVAIGWSKSENAVGYRVYRSATGTRPSQPLATLGNVLSYTDADGSLLPGIEYRYWVSGFNASGEAVSDAAVAYRAVRLTLATTEVAFSDAAGTTNLAVKANAAVQIGIVPAAASAWLTAACASSVLSIGVSANGSAEGRTAQIVLTAGTDHARTAVVTVDQNGMSALPVPDLAFVLPTSGWNPDFPVYTAAASDSAVATRLFKKGDAVHLRYAWGNVGQGVAQGLVTNVIEVGSRKQDVEAKSVDEKDIELTVVTSNSIPVTVDLAAGAIRTDSLSVNAWKSLDPGVYIAKTHLNVGLAMAETDPYNDSVGFRFAVYDPVTLEQALDLADSSVTIAASSADGWYGTKGIGADGGDCAMTRLLGDSSSCALTAQVIGAGTLSFSYRVATEASSDVLTFAVDGSEKMRDSGIGEWKQVSFEIGTGDHTFAWTYAKDALGSDGDDCVYLDQVVWTPARSGNPPEKFEASNGTYASYVQLNWAYCNGAKSYAIERAESETGPWTQIIADRKYYPATDTKALGGVTYWYRIKAVYADGESDWSDPVSGYRKAAIASCSSRTVSGAGGADSVSKTANCIWQASVTHPSGTAKWLTLDSTCGTNDFKLVYRFGENTTGSERTCTITITGAPGTGHEVTKTFTVTQRVPVDNGNIISLAEATGCDLQFRNSSEAPWFGQTRISRVAGKYAMRSAEISGNATSRVEIALARAGTLSFWWTTSSQSGCDKLYFTGAVEQIVPISGNSSGSVKTWQQVTVTIPQGGAVIAWEYTKDSSIDRGLDAGYVSEIVWTPDTADIVPSQTWFDKYPGLLAALGTDDLAQAAKMQSPGSSAKKTAADGTPWLVWMDYVCGTDPLDTDSKFKATIRFEDGVPKVEWLPKLSEEETKLRNYLIEGKKELKATEWLPVANGHEIDYNFFKVSVEMQ